MTQTPQARRSPALLYVGAVLVAALGTGGAARAQTFSELSYTLSNGSDLDLFDSSRPTSTGSQIIGTEYTTSTAEAVVMTGTSNTPTELGFLGGDTYSYGYGVSADGSTVVGASVGTGVHAVAWSGGTVTNLGTLTGYNQSVAYGASNNGSVITGVATNSTTNDSQVFRYTSGGGMTNLGALPGSYTDTSIGLAYGNTISANGSVIAGDLSSATGSLATQSFLWNSTSGVQALGFQTGGTYSITAAISSDGSTVVGYGDNAKGQQNAYKWTAATGMQGLGLAYGNFETNANSTSGNGSLIVGDYYHLNSSGTMDYESGYIYNAEYGYADIADYVDQLPGLSSAMAGWTDLDAYDISQNGDTIFGDGDDPNGNYAYWEVTDPDGFDQPYTESAGLAATLAPLGGVDATVSAEPGTLAVIPAGLALVGTAIRRRRRS